MTEIEEALEYISRLENKYPGSYSHIAILAKAYREQEANIKKYELELSKVKNLPFHIFPNPLIEENEKLTARTAALELALKESLDFLKSFHGIGKTQLMLENALSDSKLGELFQALLEYHKDPLAGDLGSGWQKVEAMRKEFNL